jgi:hypothetical protein
MQVGYKIHCAFELTHTNDHVHMHVCVPTRRHTHCVWLKSSSIYLTCYCEALIKMSEGVGHVLDIVYFPILVTET